VKLYVGEKINSKARSIVKCLTIKGQFISANQILSSKPMGMNGLQQKNNHGTASERFECQRDHFNRLLITV
jgi:hypothetical protein